MTTIDDDKGNMDKVRARYEDLGDDLDEEHGFRKKPVPTMKA
jgi:hypothetical protein